MLLLKYTLYMKKISKNLKEFSDIVLDFLSKIDKKNSATIIALSGDLGSGKTVFAKVAATYFGVEENITSPTFVIQKEYEIDKHPFFKKMIHIDAYRLEDKKELEYLGWNEIILNKENIIFIEWPEQVDGIDLPEVIHVSIKILEGESREIELS